MTLDELFHLHDSTPVNEKGCRIWPMSLTKDGYPRVTTGGVTQIATRVMLAKKLGRKVKPDMFALHTCDTPSCFSENHLFEGSGQDNMNDMVSKGRHRSKTSLETVSAIRAEKRLHPHKTIAQLAKEFGLSWDVTGRIVNYTAWREIK